ncbi:MAG: FAD-dependent oxidoreductase [Peptococcaceae bacterium]|nr:FAD-dependent oxidoreductase [Peptococcaceae bacterium]
MVYDIIIIGGGPAGISAGIYATSRGKKTVILEKAAVGGLIGSVSTVTHYAAITDNETGKSFAERLKKQALDAGVDIVYEEVTKVELKGEAKTVQTAENLYVAPKVIIACGTTPRRLGVDGEAALDGIGINLNAATDGPRFAGKNVYVIGGADGAVKEALYLADIAKSVTIIHFEDKLGCVREFQDKVAAKDNIHLALGQQLHAIYGSDRVEGLELIDGEGQTETIMDPGCGVFVYAGSVPNTRLFTELPLENGFIPVDEKMQTVLPGVYAAGDIRVKQVRQGATAVADGAIAAINAAM